jgi:hypothetical protein
MSSRTAFNKKSIFVTSGFRRDVNEDLYYSGILRSVQLWLVTDVSKRSIGRIFKNQAVEEEFFLGCLILEDGTDRLYRNVGN